MTLFQLFSGKAIKRGPGRIIPPEDFSTLLKAKKVLKTVQSEEIAYRQEVAQEAEALKEEAERVGFAKGMEAWTAQLAHLEQEIQQVEERLQKLVIPVALQAAKKIVSEEIALNPNTIASIVASHLKSVAGHKQVTIYCHRDDLEALENNKERLKGPLEHLESLSIQPRKDIERGGCVIETEAGIINAQLDLQWKALEAAFESILKQG